MSKKNLPSKEEIIRFVTDAPYPVGKRELCKHFGIKGAARVDLKKMLRELRLEGKLDRQEGRKQFIQTTGGEPKLPPVTVLCVQSVGKDKIVAYAEQNPRHTFVLDTKIGLVVGDKVLCRIKDVDNIQVIRKLSETHNRTLGIFQAGKVEHLVWPIDRKGGKMYRIPAPHGVKLPAKDGELVEIQPTGRPGDDHAKVIQSLGDPSAPKSISLIALHSHEIPIDFSDACQEEANDIQEITSLEGREDLCDLPFVTIDPEDARDHDDALYAQRDGENWIVSVAIADVAAYVVAGSAIDVDAKERGNSCYFPDRVVPMLPEKLSADLCSLHENVDRTCLVARITFAPDGKKIAHEFIRGMMRSRASLSYHQAQRIANGEQESTLPIKDLFAAYACVKQARDIRAPLDLDIAERKIILDDAGNVTSVQVYERFDAHKLVEEFMIQANVCAAETLQARQKPTMYRVHEQPSVEKIDALREILKASGLSLRKSSQVFPKQLNHVLHQAKDTPQEETVNIAVLRAQMQAYYSPENLGHFGLNLANYAHFTSPIRRYADVLVHRALTDSLSKTDTATMEKTGVHISATERRAMKAERETTDRYLAAFMQDRVNAEFDIVVNGVSGAGLFVKTLVEGAEGFIPVATLGNEYYVHDRDRQSLTGERTKKPIVNGLQGRARLRESTPLTGSLLFELLSIDFDGNGTLAQFTPINNTKDRARKTAGQRGGGGGKRKFKSRRR